MANEFTVRSSLQVRADALVYQGMKPEGFSGDLVADEPGGPTPGQIEVPEAGASVNLTVLTRFGYAEFVNLSTLYEVSIGALDTNTQTYYPLLRLRPEQSLVCDLYPLLGQTESTGTGSGSNGSGVELHLKALGGSAKVVVNVFEE